RSTCGYRWRSAPCGSGSWSSDTPVLPQAEEQGPIPARPGDGTRDRRQRLVLAPLVFEAVGHHGHVVLDALPLPDQAGAGDRAVVRHTVPTLAVGCLAVDPGVEVLAHLLRQAAVGQLLDPEGERLDEEAPAVARRLGAEVL